MRYTTIIHEARIALRLSMNDYCIADCIYHYSNNPKSPAPGWCFASKQHIADQIGITKSWAIKSISLLEKMGLIVKSPDGRMLKTTEKWYSIVIIKDYTIGVESTPVLVNTVHHSGVESTPPSYNKIYTKSLNTPESNDSVPKESLLFDSIPEKEVFKEKKIKKGGATDEFYPAFAQKWIEAYPELGFDGISGKKIKSLISKTNAYLTNSGKEVTVQNSVNAFLYVLAYVKRVSHFCHGKPITTFESQYLSIIFELKNGKTTSKPGNTRDILRNIANS